MQIKNATYFHHFHKFCDKPKKTPTKKPDIRNTVEHNYNEHAYNKFTLVVKSVSSTYLKIV